MYPHKPLSKNEVTICNHQPDSPLYVWPDVWFDQLQVQKKYGQTWHRMSLLRPGVIKQHQTKTNKPNLLTINSVFVHTHKQVKWLSVNASATFRLDHIHVRMHESPLNIFWQSSNQNDWCMEYISCQLYNYAYLSIKWLLHEGCDRFIQIITALI